MKHIGVTVRPDLDVAPSFLCHLLDSADVTEAWAVDWNRSDAAVSTHLYAIDGDATTFETLARETAGVESVSRSATRGAVSYALVRLRDEAVPVFGGAAAAIDRPGLVVRRPLVYEDGCIYGHIVGDPAVLQATLDGVPESVSVRVDAIRQFPSPDLHPTSALSDRQREALRAAVRMGYYEIPRAATQADIAAEMGCATNTASEHLRKGEAKLVRAGLRWPGAGL